MKANPVGGVRGLARHGGFRADGPHDRPKRDFGLIEPIFFSTSNVGGAGPWPPPRTRARLQRCDGQSPSIRAGATSSSRHKAVTTPASDFSQAARIRLVRPLDRRCVDPAHGRKMRSSYPGPGQSARSYRTRCRKRRPQDLDRRQLHRQLHADGGRPALQGRAGRVDEQP